MSSAVRKLIVEVIDAHNLQPIDGHGTSSPYVILDYYGQRKKTKTVSRDLNPVWNEVLEFNVGKPSEVFGDQLEVNIFHDRTLGPTSRSNFLGQVGLSSKQFVRKGEEALIYYRVEKKHFISWISWSRGEIGLKIYYVDELPPPPPLQPVSPPAEEVKTEEAPPPAAEAGVDAKIEAASDAGKSDPPAEQAPPPETNEEQTVPPPPQPENATPENENTGSPPQDGGSNRAKSEPPRPDVVPEINAFSAARSMPEVNAAGVMGPKPIPRQATVTSFSSEPTQTIAVEKSSFDLVNKMHYLFVRVVRAQSLPTNGNPIVKLAVSGFHVLSKPARKTNFFEWDQTFAFARDSPDSSSILEVSVWEPRKSSSATPIFDARGNNFLGDICFDVSEIPLRDPPDSPLAPQWYRLEGRGPRMGHLMLATWVGTQADESFADAWKTDTAGHPNSWSKIYQSPKLWYLRLTVHEGQNIPMPGKDSQLHIKAKLGFQVFRTKPTIPCNGSPSWNEDLMFVAAEPFTDSELKIFLEKRQPKESVGLGEATILLTTIERRVDDRQVAARWINVEDPKEKGIYKGRVQLRVCFDGGYHVMDEAAHVCSDYRPTARQLWKPPVGTIELGIVGCKNLLPMKTINGKGSTDAYAVAKYGNKWVRTRTISDCLDPKWNEQYTWSVHDPSTVLTIGVFDSCEVFEMGNNKESIRPDIRIGKVRIRISTLQTGKIYKNMYPLILLTHDGLKKMGEIELAVRFVRASPRIDFLHVYSQPLLPLMHHLKPLSRAQQEILRTNTVKIVAEYLALSEPPLRSEVVAYMLDADSHAFSMRKVRANWLRIITVVAGIIDVVKWVEDTRAWKNPTATLLVHALLVMLVWFPDLIIPTLAFYVFAIGAWNYRFRSREGLPHFDPKISLAESIDGDELDEEFDAIPSTRPNVVVRARYDKLRNLGARVQTTLGDFATQCERVQALVTWRDPRATGIFVGLCFVVALILYLVPSKMVAMAFGFYYLRHPLFRDQMPSPALNFFRRLPSLSDRII